MEQQQLFNNLIWLALRCYFYELAIHHANQGRETSIQLHQRYLKAEQFMLAAADEISLSAENLSLFPKYAANSKSFREEAVLPLNQLTEQYNKASLELNDFLDLTCPNENSQVRNNIEAIIQKAKQTAKSNHAQNTDQSDRRLVDFKDSMIKSFDAIFNAGLNYKEPLSNNFFMNVMTHPNTQYTAAVLLVAGLASMTLGICALAGVVPLIGLGVAIALTGAGAIGTVAGISTLSSRFFSHDTPNEVARKNGPFELPPEPDQNFMEV